MNKREGQSSPDSATQAPEGVTRVTQNYHRSTFIVGEKPSPLCSLLALLSATPYAAHNPNQKAHPLATLFLHKTTQSPSDHSLQPLCFVFIGRIIRVFPLVTLSNLSRCAVQSLQPTFLSQIAPTPLFYSGSSSGSSTRSQLAS